MKKLISKGIPVLIFGVFCLITACSDSKDVVPNPSSMSVTETIQSPKSLLIIDGYDVIEIDIVYDDWGRSSPNNTVKSDNFGEFNSLIYTLGDSVATIFKETDHNIDVIDTNTVEKPWPVYKPFSPDEIANVDLYVGLNKVYSFLNKIYPLIRIEFHKDVSGSLQIDYVIKNDINICERISYFPDSDSVRYEDYNAHCHKNINAYTAETLGNFFDKDMFAGSFLNGEDGVVFDFLGDTFKDWASSQVLNVLGLGDSSDEDLDKMLSELNKMETQLQTIAKDMQDVIAGLDQLLNVTSENFTDDEAQQLQSYEDNLGGGWNQYYSNANNNTLEDIVANPDISGAIASILTNPFLSSIYDAAEMVSGNIDGTTTQYPTLLRDFLNSTVFLFTQTVPTQGTPSSSQDFVKTIDQHNEGLMFQYAQIAKVLQQAFVMETTSLYFRYNLTGYDASLGEKGISYDDTYDENYSKLYNIFKSRFNSLHDLFQGALITDGFKTGQKYIHANTLKNTDATKGGLGLPNGTWTNSCDLYVWSGLGYIAKYDGIWDGATLKAQCKLSQSDKVGEMSNTLTSECRDAGTTNIDYYYDNNIKQGNLWCDSYNVDFIKGIVGIPHYNGALQKWEIDKESHSMDIQGMAGITYLWEHAATVTTLDDGWRIALNSDSTAAPVFEYKARSGALGTFAVLAEFAENKIQIQCMNNDPWCANDPSGQSGLEIWIGGDHIRFFEVSPRIEDGFMLLN